MTEIHTPPTPTTAETAPCPSVLILEDEPKLRALLVRAFAGGGFRAEGFDRGDEVLARAAAVHHDIAVLDVLVPGRSGIEVCRDLRATDPLIAIVMLSARADVEDRKEALVAGADDYFVKPFSLGELLDCTRALADVPVGAVAFNSRE
jgi:two-component system OmpR family response regulator